MRRRGQTSLEFLIIYAGVILPVTSMLIFTAQLLWVWGSVADYTRDGARYAATHCWQSSGDNVREYMRTHTPLMLDRDAFATGQVEILVEYFQREPESGELLDYACDGGECSSECIPDTVRVSVSGYEFRHFLSFLGLPPVAMPDFRTTVPMESAGCDPEQGVCLP